MSKAPIKHNFVFNNRWLIIDSPEAQAVDWIVSCSYRCTQELQVDPIDVRYQHKSQILETVNRPQNVYPQKPLSARPTVCARPRPVTVPEPRKLIPPCLQGHTRRQVMHTLNNTTGLRNRRSMLFIETCSLQNAAPSPLAMSHIIYFQKDCLGWREVFQAWTEKILLQV